MKFHSRVKRVAFKKLRRFGANCLHAILTPVEAKYIFEYFAEPDALYRYVLKGIDRDIASGDCRRGNYYFVLNKADLDIFKMSRWGRRSNVWRTEDEELEYQQHLRSRMLEYSRRIQQ